jgi:peptidoglycan/xylan/chitin deacetylase (PgdA/CDA1 family)
VGVAALRLLARRRSVILGYHGVAAVPPEEDPYRLQLPPAMFRAQVEMLSQAGFRFLTVAGLVREASGGTPPPGLAAVSFDDGLRNSLTAALPILRKLGAPATVYVPAGWVGGRHPRLGAAGDGAILTGDELRALAQAGWEVGSHTVSHTDLSLLDYRECRSEIERSCDELSRFVGVPVETFAYPFGRYGETAVTAVRDCGLLAAVTARPDEWRSYELPRAMVGGAESVSTFVLRVSGQYGRLEQSAAIRALRAVKRRVRRVAVGRGQTGSA